MSEIDNYALCVIKTNDKISFSGEGLLMAHTLPKTTALVEQNFFFLPEPRKCSVRQCVPR